MSQIESSERYFLYARKSTDTEDKQVRSIEDQLAELREFATARNLTIVETLVERRTAKIPGRPVFNEMLERIERGEASAILAWHPDRLSRNSVDGGRLIYLVDQGTIRDLKFPIYTFDATSQGKFTLAIAFGQSKYYVDNLSENVKRAMRQKAKSGVLPSRAPVGYLNDPRSHTIVPDPAKGPLVKTLFERYATGEWTLRQVRDLMTGLGFTNHNEKPLAVSEIQRILRNPFYFGLFRYGGELYDGTHQPLIPKTLFEKAQTAMSTRGKPRRRPRVGKLYQGVFRCGDCGAFITTETQKGHNYLRCTKRKRPCDQPYVREEVIINQVRDILFQITLPLETVDSLFQEFEKRKAVVIAECRTEMATLQSKAGEIESKLERLTIAYLDTLVGVDEYRKTKAALLHEKAAAREKLRLTETLPEHRLEPVATVLKRLNEAISIASRNDPIEQRDLFRKIGSNLTIRDRTIHYEFQPVWKYVATEAQKSRSLLRASKERASLKRDSSRVFHRGLGGVRDSNLSCRVHLAGIELSVKDN